MVVYDNLNLQNLKGVLYIKDEKAVLKNMTSSIFDGTLSLSGDISTKQEIPIFSLNLEAINFDISQSFKSLELLNRLAPIAKILDGKLNTNLKVSGNLDKAFLPDLNSVSGQALAELLVTKTNKNQEAIINQLDQELGFIDFNKLDLKALKAQLEFAEGKVVVKPFNLKYNDIKIEVSGTHGFDNSINYNALFNVPAKYLGSDVNRLIGNIDDDEINKITIPVSANIGGSYSNPIIKTDLSSSVKNLTNQLIEVQKQKLLSQGKDKASHLINSMISENKSKADSSKTEQINAVKNIVNDMMSSKKQTGDSTKITPITKSVKQVLGGFLEKKKTDTVR
jgi:hypothetical protein